MNAGGTLPDSSIFSRAGMSFVQSPAGAQTPKPEFIELLREADGAMVSTLPVVDAEVLDACPSLKVISRAGVGVDSIDISTATRLGILVCHTPGVNTTEVAEHAMAQLLTLTRMVREFDGAVKAGRWSNSPQEVRAMANGIKRIAGSTVGIVGFGAIGRAFSTRVRSFGPFRVIAYDPYISQTAADLYGVELVTFDELLAESDFVTIHAPATAETYHMFNDDTLRRMRPSAILLNCARGPIVEPDALYVALTTGQIAAAGIDVTEVEPIDAEDPLLTLNNLIMTPHIAGQSPVTAVEGRRRQAENVVRVLSGEPPHGVANPEALKTIAVMRATNPGRWAGIPDFSTALQL